MQLRWCEAEKVHRPALQAFVCTDPPKQLWDRRRGRHHPYQWELDVQLVIHRLRVPRQLPHRVLLGFEGDTLRAVIAYELMDNDNLVFVRLVACDYAARGRGLASEAYEAMFADLAELGWTGGFEVEGNIHRSNHASKKAFARAGATCVEKVREFEIWRLYRAERGS